MEEPIRDYIPVEEAAAILGVTTRQVSRYQDQVRIQKVGKRILYHRDDILALAEQRGRTEEARRTAEQYRQTQRVEATMPLSEVLTYLREKDQTIERQHQQIVDLTQRIAELETQLKQK